MAERNTVTEANSPDNAPPQPLLDDEQLDRLDDFLDSEQVGEDALDLISAHGFLVRAVARGAIPRRTQLPRRRRARRDHPAADATARQHHGGTGARWPTGAALRANAGWPARRGNPYWRLVCRLYGGRIQRRERLVPGRRRGCGHPAAALHAALLVMDYMQPAQRARK